MSQRRFRNSQLDALIHLIVDNNVLPQEAEIRANKFYRGMLNLVEDIRDAKAQVTLLEPVVKVLFAQALKRAEGDIISEKKLNAERDPEYIEAKRRLSEAQNDEEYLKQAYDTIEHGFILFRQLANK